MDRSSKVPAEHERDICVDFQAPNAGHGLGPNIEHDIEVEVNVEAHKDVE